MYQLKEVFSGKINPTEYATYPEACKARDAINKSDYAAGKSTMWSAFDASAEEAVATPVDPLWINKEWPKVEFTEGMYSSPRMTSSNDQPEGYEGE